MSLDDRNEFLRGLLVMREHLARRSEANGYHYSAKATRAFWNREWGKDPQGNRQNKGNRDLDDL